jgi:RNA polymerase sigma-70 factor, ECF subfamily
MSSVNLPTAILRHSDEFAAKLAEERRWVAGARAGDEEAIRRLLARYRPPLVRLLTGVLADAAAAEDVTQESLLHALRHLHQLRDDGSFYPWLRRQALRAALRLRNRRRELPEEAPEAAAVGADVAAEVEHRLAVQRALAKLSPDHRAVLVLREMEQLDYAEIAEALGVPVGTVRSRLFAARERFRAIWNESNDLDEGGMR